MKLSCESTVIPLLVDVGYGRQTQRGHVRLRAAPLVIEEIESDRDVDRRGGAGGQVREVW